jgi:hypothetical protein
MIRNYIWRKINPEKRTLQKRKEKVRRLLRERGFLPSLECMMSESEKKIYDDIGNGDFSFWDSVKLKGKPGKMNDGGNQEKNKKVIKTNEYLIYGRAKQSAKEKNLEFNLDVGDIIIPEYCPLLNLKLTFTFTPENRESYYSIDRIDSSKGYIKGNIQIMSFKANTMKNSATNEELVTFAKNVLKLNYFKEFYF